MTFKQLEQFLREENVRAGARRETDLCGKYARCAYCDRFCDFPCARAYDTLMKKKREGKATSAFWQFPEPDVRGRFGAVFASGEDTGPPYKLLPAPKENARYGNGKTGVGVLSLKSDGNKANGGTRGARVLVIRRRAKI